MTIPRAAPYIWISWLPKLLAGEDHCFWKAWFRAHFTGYEKLEDDKFEKGAWMSDHAIMVYERAKALRAAGYAVTVEGENKFVFRTQSGAELSGKPDIVAVNAKECLVIDCKTGKERYSDKIQVLLYLLVWPYVRPQHEELIHRGEVEYRTRSIEVLAGEADDGFRQAIKIMVRDIAGDTPLPRVPCFAECKWCDIPTSECPARVAAEPDVMALPIL